MSTPGASGTTGGGSYGGGYLPARSSPALAQTAGRGDSLADLLERVLDKGVVIAGDIVVNVLDIELLTLKVRLLIASADTAKEMGIDWWTDDPFLSGRAKDLESENRELRERLDRLERALESGSSNGSTRSSEPTSADSDAEPAAEER